MSQAMQIKQLELNVDKCGVIIFGKNKEVTNLKNTIESEKCLTLNGKEVKVKSHDKYLGIILTPEAWQNQLKPQWPKGMESASMKS